MLKCHQGIYCTLDLRCDTAIPPHSSICTSIDAHLTKHQFVEKKTKKKTQLLNLDF